MDCEGFFFSTQVQWTLKGFSSGTMCNGLWRISSQQHSGAWTVTDFSSAPRCNGLRRAFLQEPCAIDYEGFLHGEMLGVLVTHLELSFELFCFCFVRAQRPSINVKLMLQSITLKVIFHLCTAFLVPPHRFGESE
jgi:hypothetical protein